jgi:hypothetical protein
MNAEQTHQELLVFLAAHPDITNSDSSSSVSPSNLVSHVLLHITHLPGIGCTFRCNKQVLYNVIMNLEVVLMYV